MQINKPPISYLFDDTAELKQVLRFAKGLDPSYYALLMIGLCHGVHAKDLCRVHWPEIDLEAGTLTLFTRVRNNAFRQDADGERTVKLCDHCRDLLRAQEESTYILKGPFVSHKGQDLVIELCHRANVISSSTWIHLHRWALRASDASEGQSVEGVMGSLAHEIEGGTPDPNTGVIAAPRRTPILTEPISHADGA